jgi:hypothetical protein
MIQAAEHGEIPPGKRDHPVSRSEADVPCAGRRAGLYYMDMERETGEWLRVFGEYMRVERNLAAASAMTLLEVDHEAVFHDGILAG